MGSSKLILSSEILAKEKKVSLELIEQVSLTQITETLTVLKLKLQAKGFGHSQIRDYFFKPFVGEEEITIKTVQEILDTNGIDED